MGRTGGDVCGVGGELGTFGFGLFVWREGILCRLVSSAPCPGALK